MPNPPVPAEQKRRLGNPGHRPLPNSADLVPLQPLVDGPLRTLGRSGQQMWDMVHTAGQTWLSASTDVYLLQLVCEQFDRRDLLLGALETDTTNRALLMSIIEIEKSITGNLSLLGFTPTDRSKLGVAEVKSWTKIDELQERRANL